MVIEISRNVFILLSVIFCYLLSVLFTSFWRVQRFVFRIMIFSILLLKNSLNIFIFRVLFFILKVILVGEVKFFMWMLRKRFVYSIGLSFLFSFSFVLFLSFLFLILLISIFEFSLFIFLFEFSKISLKFFFEIFIGFIIRVVMMI